MAQSCMLALQACRVYRLTSTEDSWRDSAEAQLLVHFMTGIPDRNRDLNSLFLRQKMHWELHPTERPAHSQIPWFWVPESEIFPQLISIATATEIVLQLRRVAEETLDAMSQVTLIRERLSKEVCREGRLLFNSLN